MSKIISEQILTNIDDTYIRETITYTTRAKRTSYKIVRRVGTIAACLGLIFVLSTFSITVATAAGNMTAYDILYSLYPDVATKLTPVNESCEEMGIKMSVESIYVHDNSADIYISMQDLTGDRIDETIDLFDSYSIHTTCDQVGGCSLVDYDATTKTATFLISVQQMEGKRITGRKMTFSISKFLSGKYKSDEELTDISLENAPIISDVQTEVDIRGWGGTGADDFSVEDISGFLIPNDNQHFSPVDGVTITGYGFIDNQLHVQVYYKDIVTYDNHGYIYLKDSDGNTIDCRVNVSFWDNDKIGSYEEYIFDINPEDDLSSYSTAGYFSTCQTITTGNWEVTFPIENKE